MEFLGIFMPLIVDTIGRNVTNSEKRLWLSFIVCSVAGVLFNWVNTQFMFESPVVAFDSITKSIMMVFGLAQISFKAYWEKTEAHDKLRNQ